MGRVALMKSLTRVSEGKNAPSLSLICFASMPGPRSVVSGQRKTALWGHLDTRGERPYSPNYRDSRARGTGPQI